MQRTVWSLASLALIMAVALLGRVEAQQYQQHHPGSAQGMQERMDDESQEEPAHESMEQMQDMMEQMQGMMQQMQGMMRHRYGRMGRGGMMGHGMRLSHRDMMRHMHHQLGHLTQQLDLSEEQQTKAQALMRSRAKEAIRLQADIDTAAVDLQQLLEAQPVDMAAVKTTLQTIAGKKADLRFLHITAMQDIRALLTPEQEEQFRAMWQEMMRHGGKMMRHGGKMRHKGMMGHRGMRKHGQQMGHGGRYGSGHMMNPGGMQR
jgi:Spy/CpxP family protein refolding chaperone